MGSTTVTASDIHHTPALGTPIGLKEWAVAVSALDAGDQILLLRKGGIAEKQFLVEHEEFYLYPTYEHQQAGQLQARFHAALARELATPRDPQTVRITNWVRVAEAYPITAEATADALAAHTLWTPEYIRERLHWRPKKPLYAMLLRVYRLAEPREIPYLPAYGGCKSWLALDDALRGAPVTPVLDDAAFAARLAPLRAILDGC